MSIIIQDAARYPNAFSWFGAIPTIEIENWLQNSRLALPSDLIELWWVTGGGDLFESETILRPKVASTPNECFVDDEIESFNDAAVTTGLYIFQRGIFLSAVRLQHKDFVSLTKDHAIVDRFNSLDDWYVHTLRAEFGERYGISPLASE